MMRGRHRRGFRTRPSLRPFRRLLGGVLLLVSLAPAAAAIEIRGVATIGSGNEILVGKRSVHLFGIRAPLLEQICESKQAKYRCGVVAWAELIKLADGQFVSCDIERKAEKRAGEDNPDQERQRDSAHPDAPDIALPANAVYATCYLGETDLSEALVRAGWAWAAPQQTERYMVDEADARGSRRGMWASYKKRKRNKKAKR